MLWERVWPWKLPMLSGFKRLIRPNKDSNTAQTLSRAPKEKVGAEGERKGAAIGKQQRNKANPVQIHQPEGPRQRSTSNMWIQGTRPNNQRILVIGLLKLGPKTQTIEQGETWYIHRSSKLHLSLCPSQAPCCTSEQSWIKRYYKVHASE